MIFAKKSLGQNFLKNKTIIDEIIKAGEINAREIVLEIGPGEGILTKALLETGATVVAVEKDDRLINILNEKFSNYVEKGQFVLIHSDILEISPANINLNPGNYKIVANIPYYITGQILRLFLESDCQPASIVLMIQKEVAERIIARDGKQSILSMSVKAYGIPKYIRTVARGNFQPAPNVDSAILLINNISKNYFDSISETHFFDVLKRGFGQKRKMLKGNLGIMEKTLENCGISPKARAEELTLDNWKSLVKTINEK